MQFFKNIFRKPRLSAEVAVDELPQWFAQEARPIIVQLQTDVSTRIRELQQLKDQLTAQLEHLGKAQLQNPNIPPKAKTMMESSRAQFISAAQLLLALEIPNHAAAEELEPFVKQVGERFAQFSKSTKRSAAILTEFFAHELRGITSTLATFERTTHGCYPSRYQRLMALQNTVQGIAQRDEACAKMRIELEAYVQQKKQLEEQHRKAEQERNKAKEGREYERLMQLEAQQEELLRQQRQLEASVDSLFGPLLPILKKVEDPLLSTYRNGPFTALRQDRAMGVLGALQRLQMQLEQGTVEAKPEKLEKAKKGISQINEEKLQLHLDAALRIDEALRKVQQQIAGNAVKSRTAEAQYRIDHVRQRMERLAEEEEKIRKAIAARNVDEEARGLAAELSELLEKDVLLRAE